MFLRGKDLWGHIDGTYVKPTITKEAMVSGTDTTQPKWPNGEPDDAMKISWILSLVDPQTVLNMRPYKTAKGMWEYLKRVCDAVRSRPQ